MASVIGPYAKRIYLVLSSFYALSLIKLHPFRPHKKRHNARKNAQMERNRLQSLKFDDDNGSDDRYGNILLRRVSDFNSCLQIDVRVSIWLPFGHILHIFGS